MPPDVNRGRARQPRSAAAPRSSVAFSRSALPVVLFVLIVVGSVAAEAWTRSGAGDSRRIAELSPAPASTAVVATEVRAAGIVATAVGTQVPAEPAAPSPSPPPPPACQGDCLVRLAAPNPDVRATLMRRGLLPAYDYGGWLWGGAPATLVAELRSAGTEVVVVERSTDTLSLYVVRLPSGDADDDPVYRLGDVLDRVGAQFIVQISDAPPYIMDLTASGIWVEKFPPVIQASGPTGSLPRLTRAAPFGDQLSDGQLRSTILHLQDMGGDSGETTRFYTSPGGVEAAEYIFGRLREYGLEVWYEDFVADTGTIAKNVVGELPGRDPSRTYLVIAHYDSTSDTGVAPGADDNASGVAALIEIARVLSGYDLAHPVRFAALTAEEVGLQGSKAFVARAASEGVEFTGAFNLDAIGSPARDHELILNADASSAWLQELLVSVNQDYGVGQQLLIRQNDKIVADDTILREAGIPAVLVTRAVVGENPVHHTADDVFDKIDMHGVEEVTLLILLALADVLSDP